MCGAMNVQRAVWQCLFIVVLSCGLHYANATDIAIVDSEGKHIGKISMKGTIYPPQKQTSIKIDSKEALGSVKDKDVSVQFNLKDNHIFSLFFKSDGDNVFLNTATIGGQLDNATWTLNKNLGSSNASYKCYYLYATSEAHRDGKVSELVFEELRIQVFNFHSDFSEAVTCDEDKPGLWTGSWTLNNTDGIPCLRLSGAMAFNITYKTLGNEYSTASVNLPSSAMIMPESYCSSPDANINTTTEQLLELGFYDRWTLKLHFTRDPNITQDKQEDHWMVDWVELKLKYENHHFPMSQSQSSFTFKNEVSSKGEGALGLFRTRNGRSYSCNAAQEKMVVTNFTVFTESVQAQPFMNHPEFSQVESCAADLMVSDVVPIIIGAALAVLIVVVLVAYLIGRARTRRQTYENI